MWKYALILMCAALMACNTPSRGFRDIAPTRVNIGQSAFEVRVKADRAEAIRVNAEWAPRLAATAPRGVAAMELVTGCRVRRLLGDQAMMVADLDCGGARGPLPEQRPEYYDCDSFAITDSISDLTCEPVFQ